MTSVLFVTAALLLGAEESGTPVADLQQPGIVRQDSLEVVLGSANQKTTPANQGGVVKFVRYESESAGTTIISDYGQTKSKSVMLLQEGSPSDLIAEPPAVPQVDEMEAPESFPATSHSMDYAIDSCGCGHQDACGSDTCQSGCGCDSGCQCDSGCGTCGIGGGCGSCGCGGCGAHGLMFGDYWAKHCLPSTSNCHGPGNMTPHIPYWAEPKTYYYFRPYNMLHVTQQQTRALSWVEQPGLPYSNKVFDKIYAELAPMMGPQEAENVPVPSAPSMPVPVPPQVIN